MLYGNSIQSRATGKQHQVSQGTWKGSFSEVVQPSHDNAPHIYVATCVEVSSHENLFPVKVWNISAKPDMVALVTFVHHASASLSFEVGEGVSNFKCEGDLWVRGPGNIFLWSSSQALLGQPGSKNQCQNNVVPGSRTKIDYVCGVTSPSLSLNGINGISLLAARELIAICVPRGPSSLFSALCGVDSRPGNCVGYLLW